MAVGSVGGGLGASAAAAAGTETATAIEDLPADILALVLRRLDSASLAAVGKTQYTRPGPRHDELAPSTRQGHSPRSCASPQRAGRAHGRTTPSPNRAPHAPPPPPPLCRAPAASRGDGEAPPAASGAPGAVGPSPPRIDLITAPVGDFEKPCRGPGNVDLDQSRIRNIRPDSCRRDAGGPRGGRSPRAPTATLRPAKGCASEEARGRRTRRRRLRALSAFLAGGPCLSGRQVGGEEPSLAVLLLVATGNAY
ncbi:hypothetical protein PVAP13_2KG298201 [Panicum virgatum]|uniref:F-box domain-containing protein n=1 Tax=Panicum virgatum TaxID=38727 RepID=A0A8T0WG35_PANVG|nr:hypothetical protein PVAP13_2KG298201 [Panicum virgatum]KAG2644225.1 hypothetical protein PVAP13_2KG298201 [Panicum virgatum]KAG2644226.1 hypothetical protein PVAP13_2KG298201 [Panicum virgatum]